MERRGQVGAPESRETINTTDQPAFVYADQTSVRRQRGSSADALIESSQRGMRTCILVSVDPVKGRHAADRLTPAGR